MSFSAEDAHMEISWSDKPFSRKAVFAHRLNDCRQALRAPDAGITEWRKPESPERKTGWGHSSTACFQARNSHRRNSGRDCCNALLSDRSEATSASLFHLWQPKTA